MLRRRLLTWERSHAEPIGFGAIGGAPGLRYLKLSVEDAWCGCVAKLAIYLALGVGTLVGEPVVCVSAAAPWGGWRPAAIMPY